MHNIFRLRLGICVHLFAVMVEPGSLFLYVHTCVCNILCRIVSACRMCHMITPSALSHSRTIPTNLASLPCFRRLPGVWDTEYAARVEGVKSHPPTKTSFGRNCLATGRGAHASLVATKRVEPHQYVCTTDSTPRIGVNAKVTTSAKAGADYKSDFINIIIIIIMTKIIAVAVIMLAVLAINRRLSARAARRCLRSLPHSARCG